MDEVFSYFNLRNRTIMLIPNYDYRKNGHERKNAGGYPVLPRFNGYYLSDHNPNREKMESIKLWLGVLYGTGLVSYVMAVIVNIGSWKSNVLFAVGFIFACARILFFIVDKYQSYQLRQLQIRREKRHVDIEDKFDNH